MTGSGQRAVQSPRNAAKAIECLAMVLLPGDSDFPSGAEAGVQTRLVERLAELEGQAAVERLVAGVEALAASEPEARRSVVERFEAAEPALFATVLNLAFLSYYENPFVQAAIRHLGFAYNATPLPKGYGVRRFDMVNDVPTHGRGHYIPTQSVTRVDLSGLDIEELRHGR